MARIEVVIPAKPGLTQQDLARCVAFSEDLKAALVHSCHEHAIKISSLPDDAFGTEAAIAKDATGTASADAVAAMVTDLPLSHTQLQARTFLSSKPKNSFGRAHFGYVSEEGIEAWMAANSKFKRDIDYLYNVSVAKAPAFPICFTGSSKSARPDWRLSLTSSGGEGLFDATSPLQKGHLCAKKVNSTKLDKMAKVLYGAEVIYEEQDSYFAASGGGGKVTRPRRNAARYAPY